MDNGGEVQATVIDEKDRVVSKRRRLEKFASKVSDKAGEIAKWVEAFSPPQENGQSIQQSHISDAMMVGFTLAQAETVAAVAAYLPLLGPSIALGKSTVRLVQAIRAKNVAGFITARNTGIAVERARLNAHLSTFSSCRMLQLLQHQLAAMIIHAADQSEVDSAFQMLGLPKELTDHMSKAAQNQIGRALTAQLCSVLNPVHTRINAIFRNYAICGGGLAAKKPYGSPNEATAKEISHEFSDAVNRAESEKNAFMPHKATCADDDIYDVALVTGDGTPTGGAIIAKWELFGCKKELLTSLSIHACSQPVPLSTPCSLCLPHR